MRKVAFATSWNKISFLQFIFYFIYISFILSNKYVFMVLVYYSGTGSDYMEYWYFYKLICHKKLWKTEMVT